MHGVFLLRLNIALPLAHYSWRRITPPLLATCGCCHLSLHCYCFFSFFIAAINIMSTIIWLWIPPARTTSKIFLSTDELKAFFMFLTEKAYCHSLLACDVSGCHYLLNGDLDLSINWPTNLDGRQSLHMTFLLTGQPSLMGDKLACDAIPLHVMLFHWWWPIVKKK